MWNRVKKLFDSLNEWSDPVVDSHRIGGESISKQGAAAEWIYRGQIQTECQR